MSNELKVIDKREIRGQNFKMYGTIEQPLFLAKDVAEWIDYSFKDSREIHRDVSKMLATVDDNEKLKNSLKLGGEDCSHGGIRENVEMWFLTEDGLYEVLMLSRKPIAKEFKKEVKHILKTLRATGGYINDTNKFIDTYYKNVSPEIREACRQQFVVIEELNKKIEQDKPKVAFAEAVDCASNCIAISDLAKLLKIFKKVS